jgi:hypothetical protein
VRGADWEHGKPEEVEKELIQIGVLYVNYETVLKRESGERNHYV